MSITDELREWKGRIQICLSPEAVLALRGELTAIADRIDAAHQKALDEWKAEHGQMWLKGYAECHAELLEGNETLASDLERCGWIRLPKDADGEYIHIGDRMENNERVARIVLTDDSWEPSVYLEKLPNVLHEYFCNEISHYHAPTVEDVMVEFAIDWESAQDGEDKTAVLKEYAAKLRLADDGKEQ